MLQKKNSAGLEMKGSSAVQQCLRDATSSFSAGSVTGDISTKGCSWDANLKHPQRTRTFQSQTYCAILFVQPFRGWQCFKWEAKLLQAVNLQHPARHNVSDSCTLQTGSLTLSLLGAATIQDLELKWKREHWSHKVWLRLRTLPYLLSWTLLWVLRF